MSAGVQLGGRTSVLGGIPVLQMDGDADIATLPHLVGVLQRFVEDNVGRRVIVDLDGLASLDDAALGLLLGAAGRARQHGGDLVVVCTDARRRARFSVSRLDRALDLFASLGAAGADSPPASPPTDST